MQTHEFGGGVLLHVRRGIMHAGFAPHVIEHCERHIRQIGRVVLMVDAHETKMHTTEFREVMTDWFREHENASVHMLIQSRMLEMALNVANLALGGQRAKAYFDAQVWEQVGRREATTFARRPLVLPAGVKLRGA